MKNVFLAAFCVLAFASCSNNSEDILNEEKMETVTFSVTTSEETTRAYWVNHQVYWNSTDKLKVYATYHKDGSDFMIDEPYEANLNDIAFTGKTYVGTFHDHEYIFVYPAGQAKSFDGNNAVTVEIPATQTASLNSFDPKACIQIGSTKVLKGFVALFNVCAFLKIEVSEPCEYVKVTADGSYGVGGVFEVSKEAVINPDWNTRYPTVTLNNLYDAGTYLIAIGPSQDKYPELNVEVKFKNYDKPLTNHVGEISIAKGRVYNLGKVNAPGPEN